MSPPPDEPGADQKPGGEGSGRCTGPTAPWMTPVGFASRRADTTWVRTRLLLIALVTAVVGLQPAPARSQPPPGAAACPLFPADDVWHADVSQLPVHSRSGAWLASMGGPTRRIHPDFGPSGEAMPYGIPYAVVRSSHQKVAVDFEYADESDPGPYPFGPDIPVESGSDRHALMLDADTCTLYELYAAEYQPGGSTAGSGAIWNLRSSALRPAGWTSADAAGLPILPGLLRRDEVAAGYVDHAIRLTAQRTDRSYVWPARHQAGAAADPNLPPMGARFRLRAGFDVSRFRPDTQVVLRAMQRHGLILADNGSNWYFTGTAEDGWDTAMLDELKTVPAGEFEAVDASSLMVDPNSGRVRGGVAGTGPAPGPAPTTRRPTRPAAVATTTAPPPVPTTTTLVAETTTTAAVPDTEGQLANGPPRTDGVDDDPWWPSALALVALLGVATPVAVWVRRRVTPPPSP